MLLAMQLMAVRCWFADAQPVSPPATIRIGALLAYNSTIGKAVRPALELAVRDINNSSLLGDSQLVLHLGNSNCSAFQGAATGKHVPLLRSLSYSSCSHLCFYFLFQVLQLEMRDF